MWIIWCWNENCKCIKKSIKQCGENNDTNEMIYNGTLNDYEKTCNYCTIYTVLLIIGISSAHFLLVLKKK